MRYSQANDVEHCTFYGPPGHGGSRRLAVYAPQGLTSAQLNLPCWVATLFVEGDAFLAQSSEEMVADPARMALSPRVTCEEETDARQLATLLASRW